MIVSAWMQLPLAGPMRRIAAIGTAMMAVLVFALPCDARDSTRAIDRMLSRCANESASGCRERIESRFLKSSRGKVRHEGAMLTIQTRSKKIAFQDRPVAEQETAVHTYLGLLAGIGYHLILVELWEGSRFILVSDRSAQQFTLSAIPHVSPSRKKLVAVSASEAYNPNEITIWKVSPAQLRREYRYEPQNYAQYHFIAWDGDQRIRLKNFTRSDAKLCPGHDFMTIGEVLQATQGKWDFALDRKLKPSCEIEAATQCCGTSPSTVQRRTTRR